MPPELLGTERSKTEAVGTGPMMLKGWKPDQYIEWERNPTYFKKDKRTGMQLPYLDGMRGQVYGDRNSLARRLASGQIDQIPPGLWPQRDQERSASFDDPNAVYQVVSPSTWGMTHIAFKLEKAPWNDVRVRRALSLALNRKDMVDGLADGLAAEGAYPLDWTFFKDAKTGEFQEWPWRPDQLGQYQKYDPARRSNCSRPPVSATQKPLEFEAVGIVAADRAAYCATSDPPGHRGPVEAGAGRDGQAEVHGGGDAGLRRGRRAARLQRRLSSPGPPARPTSRTASCTRS